MKKHKFWQLRQFEGAKANRLVQELGVSNLLAVILLNRGIEEPKEAYEFLYGSKHPFAEPLLMKDMAKAVGRIRNAIDGQEHITVYGDYDVDGISASALLYLFLKDQGAIVDTYIPQRKNEGYGLNAEAIKSLYEKGTTLLVTVDCGISAENEIAGAAAGLDIIVTDHHMPPDVLPKAYAIINPHQKDCEYPFKHLSGVGVAFKLCQAVYQASHLSEPLWADYTELVALGTVADIVPLKGENRELVKMGLKAMEKTRSIGLKKLMQTSGCPAVNIKAENIGFILAPRLNAVGRLEHAQSAVELLVTQEDDVATSTVTMLNKENVLRQEISKAIFEEAEAILAQEGVVKTAIILAKEGWHPGVIGIVASRLVEKYHVPTILMSIDGDTVKGSCRSIPKLDLYDTISECGELLEQFGGHHQAAGLTLHKENLQAFKDKFTDLVASKLTADDYLPKLDIDAYIDAEEVIDLEMLAELNSLEPFGCENPIPQLAFQDAVVHYAKSFGRDSAHLRFFVDLGSASYYCLMWNGADYLPCLYEGSKIDFVFMPKLNVWQNRESVNLQLLDFRQDNYIFDYRSASMDKDNLVKSVLQTGEKTVLYLSNASAAAAIENTDQLRVLSYGEPCDADAKRIIFYDMPETFVFRKGDFPLKGFTNSTLYLAYNAKDYEKAMYALGEYCLDRRSLVAVYKRIVSILKAQAVIGEADLLKNNPQIRSIHLDVFKELDFIHLENGQISVGNIRKKDLSESPTFKYMQENKRIYQTIYLQSMQITQQQVLELYAD